MNKNSNKACFSSFSGMILQETRDKRQETRDKRQETRDKRQETRDKRQDDSLILSDTFRIFQEFFTGYFYYFFDGVLR